MIYYIIRVGDEILEAYTFKNRISCMYKAYSIPNLPQTQLLMQTEQIKHNMQ